MDIYSNKNRWKLLLLVGAIAIGALTLWYTNTFVSKLREQEEQKMELWAKATREYSNPDTKDVPYILTLQEIISSNTTIPVILVNGDGKITGHKNIDEQKAKNEDYLWKLVNEMEQQREPIEIGYSIKGEEFNMTIYYKDSILLTKLQYYPIIMLGIIGVFMLIAYAAFSNARRSEQNRVWAGMAKETAHQIGTPLSSLIGWNEILRGNGVDESILSEIEKDINRLQTITERFSKIGSQPEIKPHNLIRVTEKSMAYLQSRASSKIKFGFYKPEGIEELRLPMNIALYEWVIENLIRNAIDAMETGVGEIDIHIFDHPKNVYIEVSDTGKGLPKSKHQTIFKPGYTSKKRGWGLGLSLAKRIIEEYHNGKIFVHKSEPNKGTTFRIILKK